jgi:Fic family protein
MRLRILSRNLLETYCQQVDVDLLQSFSNLIESDLSIDNFSFYTSVSVVFSSKIEGEEIELDSYIKHKRFGIEFLPDYTQKIDDLYNAYQFAKSNSLNRKNIEEAHKIATKHILPVKKQGEIRNHLMYVTTDDGEIEYVAALPSEVNFELLKFYEDLEILLKSELSIEEIFYFAAYIHLVFVKIHPFNDGNGRSGRLIEKWFLADKLGPNAWLMESEKNYYNQHQTYYNNLRVLGLEYETLDYEKALSFLLMLPNSLRK